MPFIEGVTAFACGYVAFYFLWFLILGKNLKITLTRKDGSTGSTMIKFRPLDSVHRDLLRVRLYRIKRKLGLIKAP